MELSTISTGLSTIGMGGGDSLYRPDFAATVDNTAVTGRVNRQPDGASSEWIAELTRRNTRSLEPQNVRFTHHDVGAAAARPPPQRRAAVRFSKLSF